MLFRIEDVDGFDPNRRSYDMNDYQSFYMDKCEVHKKIAGMIRDEVNGSKSRVLHSYSKSLAACLFKYNKYTDNELHLFMDEFGFADEIYYISQWGKPKRKWYSLVQRVSTIEAHADDSLFNKAGFIILTGFVIDISNNSLLNEYLRHYVGVGIKSRVSPEKDSEVVVLNPMNDQSIRNYIGAVYVIYALQQKYGFLSNANVRFGLIHEIMSLDEFQFYYGEQERYALVNLINYLASNWDEEYRNSLGIYEYLDKQEHMPFYYDSILQYFGIMSCDFEESFDLISYYQQDVVTSIALRYCAEFLGKQVIACIA